MINECRGLWRSPAHARLPPPRNPQVRLAAANPLARSVCRRTYCIFLLPRISLNNASDSFGHRTVLASVQHTGHPRHWPFKKSKSPKCPWLTNHPSLPVCVAIQTAYRVLWPCSPSLHDIRPVMNYGCPHQQSKFVLIFYFGCSM